jgi:peroxiredoxin
MLCVLCLLLGAGCASSLVGKAAPDFRLRDQDNHPIQLSDYQGKTSLVLQFYYAAS